MTFLVIDTSGDYGVVALGENDGSVKAVSVFEGRRTLSRRLLGVIDTLLKENGLTLRALTGLAVGIGPGSFTGLRVGLTTMKTFAQVTGLPLVGVGTLDAYAYAVDATSVAVATPSRRGEVYVAIYAFDPPGSPFPGEERGWGRGVSTPIAASTSDLAGRLLSIAGGLVLTGGPGALAEILAPQSLSAPIMGDQNVLGILRVPRPWTPPEGLARISAARLTAGEVDNPISLVPAYVVPPAISTPRDSSILPAAQP